MTKYEYPTVDERLFIPESRENPYNTNNDKRDEDEENK